MTACRNNTDHSAAQAFALFDHSPIGKFVLKNDFTVLFWNRCLEAWTGILREQILGSSIFSCCPNLKSDRYMNRIKELFSGGAAVVFSSQIHKYIVPAPLPGGKFRFQHTEATSLPAHKTGEFYALFSIQDVTSLTDALSEQQQALKQLRDEIAERELVEKRLEGLVADLQKAMAEIRTLRGIIPICANCKKIRDDKGIWEQIELYIRSRTEAEFSHGLCPECAKKLYPDIFDK